KQNAMSHHLLVVESPAKAKTIEKILGNAFQVRSCYGHVRDLVKENMGIEIDNNFKTHYEIPEDKQKVVSELKTLAAKANEIWLATDEDREGESISWHLCEVLGLDPKTTKRIAFHEITKPAILEAVQHPRTVDMNLVNAQQARRVLDRIVGFEVSPILWRKTSAKTSLSAGRVQSVAVRIIVEREKEIQSFTPTSSLKIEALFNNQKGNFKALAQNKHTIEEAEKFLALCQQARFAIHHIEVKPGKRTPSSPFTTSTLQQEAARKLGYGVSKTMQIAQKLYENGYITYMRTDSVNLSQTALQNIKQIILQEYGEEYYHHRKYQTKSSNAQEAHEAIRPTEIGNHTINNSEGKKLYELIWKRTMASQMSDTIIEKTIAKINISNSSEQFTAQGEVLKFDGFLKVYKIATVGENNTPEKEDTPTTLPPLKEGESVNLAHLSAHEKFTTPEPRYNEASLVKKLEEMGIGRPSTYAPTIATIQRREYVEKKSTEGKVRQARTLSLINKEIQHATITETYNIEKNKLFPTDLGILVNTFLIKYFPTILDYNFTANIEEDFDKVAEGKTNWEKLLQDFYSPFKNYLQEASASQERIKGERELGVDPISKQPILAKMGKYGAMIQLGNGENDQKPKFAKLLKHQSIQTIMLEEALQLLSLPKNLGNFEDTKVDVNIGQFGPYILHNNKFVSLPKEKNLFNLTLPEAIEIILAKREKLANALIKDFPEQKIQVLNGRFGAYIKAEKGNYKIPKEWKAKTQELTIEEIKDIIANSSPSQSSVRKKPTTQKPSKKATK
ncbi:MAG: type I DNA topoisomerase, partial [Chitinophagaceae bacterium]